MSKVTKYINMKEKSPVCIFDRIVIKLQKSQRIKIPVGEKNDIFIKKFNASKKWCNSLIL